MAVIPPSLTNYIVTATAAVCASAATLGIKAWLGRRNTNAKAGKDEAETESIAVKTLQGVVATLIERIDDCEKDRAGLHKQLEELTKRFTELERVMVLFRRRLERADLSTDMEAT